MDDDVDAVALLWPAEAEEAAEREELVDRVPPGGLEESAERSRGSQRSRGSWRS